MKKEGAGPCFSLSAFTRNGIITATTFRIWVRIGIRIRIAPVAVDIIQIGTLLNVEEHVDACRQTGRWCQHAERTTIFTCFIQV